MILNIISPEEKFSCNIKSITFPGAAGSFTILDNHAPIFSLLQKGTVSYCCDEKGNEIEFQIKRGFMEATQKEVNVFVN